MNSLPRSFLSVSRRRTWRTPLCLILVILLILDQRRRARRVAHRFAELYKGWFTGHAAKEFLQNLHASVKALLAIYDPDQLKEGMNVKGVDLAIAGGGFKSLYALGASFALQHAGYRIDRTSGASAGAYLAVMLAGNRYRVDDLLKENLLGWCDCCVQAVRECKTFCLGGIWSYMSAELTKRLNGWLPQPNTVFLSVTTLGRNGLTEHITTRFNSTTDLEQTVNASMAIPVILCNGLVFPWRGQWCIDGGFANNCPVSIFRSSSFKDIDADPIEEADIEDSRVIIQVDCNWIAGQPVWRKLLHVAYAPSQICKEMLMAGVRDMLEILSTGKEQLNGITVIKPDCLMFKRQYSYQMFPGKEHVRRLSRRLSRS